MKFLSGGGVQKNDVARQHFRKKLQFLPITLQLHSSSMLWPLCLLSVLSAYLEILFEQNFCSLSTIASDNPLLFYD
jgi:hypothetical protein